MINSEKTEAGWKGLYRAGGVAALAAGALFRRNLGAEISLISRQQAPENAGDWFGLLAENRLLGLVYLNVFDLVNYALVGVMLLALGALLWQSHKSQMAIAVSAGLMGIAAYFATNTALSMLALSEQYAAATSEAQRRSLEAAGEALLALSRFSSAGAQPGSGGYVSLMLVAIAGMMISAAMLRGEVFSRATAVVGMIASGLDLAYGLSFALLPGADSELLAVNFLPAAGLLWMIWHLLAGWRLYQLGK